MSYHPCILKSLYNQKQGISLSFKSTVGQRTVHTQPWCSCHKMPERSTWDFLTFQTLVRKWQSRQCYRSRSIKILCKILMSWGNIWSSIQQTVIDQVTDQWWFRQRT